MTHIRHGSLPHYFYFIGFAAFRCHERQHRIFLTWKSFRKCPRTFCEKVRQFPGERIQMQISTSRHQRVLQKITTVVSEIRVLVTVLSLSSLYDTGVVLLINGFCRICCADSKNHMFLQQIFVPCGINYSLHTNEWKVTSTQEHSVDRGTATSKYVSCISDIIVHQFGVSHTVCHLTRTH